MSEMLEETYANEEYPHNLELDAPKRLPQIGLALKYLSSADVAESPQSEEIYETQWGDVGPNGIFLHDAMVVHFK